ncbi:MAG: hypothetical protein JXX29_06420 [Deltaproteobacteria bacterium]|nr:hypothetical protein [Deltaproteobacteria bacterium]MBN2671286.1 hypothetical protein [Deltaproteobacteria bacterium]
MKHKYICLFWTVAVTVWGVGCTPEKASPKPPTEQSPASPAVKDDTKMSRDAEPLILYRWPREAKRYELSFSSALSSANGSSLMNLRFTASLDVMSVSESDEQKAVFVCTDPQLVVDGEVDASKMKLVQQELSAPVIGIFTDGRLSRLQFTPGLSTFSVGIWRSLLSYLQVSDSPNGEHGFNVAEYDGNGQYEAMYTRDSVGKKWSKKKLKYTKGLWENALSASEHHPVPVLVSSAMELVTDGKHLSQISAQDSVKVAIAGSGHLLSVTSLQLTSSREVPKMARTISQLPAKMMTLDASEPFLADLPEEAMDRQRMAGLTFEQLLEALKAKAVDPNRDNLWQKKNEETADSSQLEAAAEWTEDWSKYFSALPAFFRQQPQTLKRAEAEIRLGSAATRSLLGGLSSAGTQETQRLLLKLALDKKLDVKTREGAIRNLVQCRKPTWETAQSVWKLRDHELLSRYALFGTGIIARKLNQEGRFENGNELVDKLIAELDTGKDADTRRDILRGLSNSADERILPTMKRLLRGDDVSDRAGALEALRLLGGGAVDELIALHLDETTEPVAAVRLVAIQTAARRERREPLLSALIAAAKTDSDTRTKREARRVLFGWSQDLPELKQILENIAASEDNSVAQ